MKWLKKIREFLSSENANLRQALENRGEENRNLAKQIQNLEKIIKDLRTANAEKSEETARLQADNRNLKTKVRKQSKADVLYTSLEIISETLKDEPDESLIDRLQSQRQSALSNLGMRQLHGNPALSGLGLFGNLLGRML